MEASLTPMTYKFFLWETQQNSLCYVYLGVCCLIGYIALMLLQGHSKVKLMDRTALLIGAIGVGSAQLIGFFTFPLGYFGAPWIFPVFMGVLALCLATLVSILRIHPLLTENLAVHARPSSFINVQNSSSRQTSDSSSCSNELSKGSQISNQRNQFLGCNGPGSTLGHAHALELLRNDGGSSFHGAFRHCSGTAH